MRCPTCAAFVDDTAASCAACGAEIAGVAAATAAPPAPEGGSKSGRRPSGVEPKTLCDLCQGSFPAAALQAVDGKKLCEACLGARTKAAEHRAHGSDPGRPGTPPVGKRPSTAISNRTTAKGSPAPVLVLGLGVVAVGGVALWLGVLGGGSPPPAPPAPPPATVEAPPDEPVTPTPTRPEQDRPVSGGFQKPKQLEFEGVLQPIEQEPGGKVKPLRFVDRVTGRELRITDVGKWEAKEFEEGSRYRITYLAMESAEAIQTIKFSLATVPKTEKLD